MASQHGSGFVSPIFNQNFPPNNFNMNNRMDRPQFQTSVNPPNRSFQAPERFAHGFQNRPHFSNFPGTSSFLNRPPPPSPSPTIHPPPLSACNPFPGPSNSSSHQSFLGSSTSPLQQPFQGPSNSHSHQSFPCPLNSASRPPFPSQPPAPSHASFSTHPPLPPPLSHHSPVRSHPPPLSQPTFTSQHPFPPHQPPLTHNQPPNISNAPQHNQFSNMSHIPQHNQFSNISRPPQHNQLPNISNLQQSQFPPISHSLAHQGFRLHSPSSSPAAGPRFDNSFQRPYKSWNKMTRFSGPRLPFSNRSPNVVKSHQFKDASQHVNKKKLKSREFRKLKEDFTEKPYSCDTCDRAFVTENELNDHISQHIKCDYETCTFKAHPKIVMLHKKMQHETGYAEHISKLKDDAEVKKWREERKKRFPTAENIRKRKAEQAEKIARGEILETKEFGKFKRKREENRDLTNSHRKRFRGHRGKRNHWRRNFHEQHPGFQQIKVNSESDSDSDSHISLTMFSGLSSLGNSAEEVCYTDEIVETNCLEQNLPKYMVNIANDVNHINVSHSENNSIDRKNESSLLSNAETLRGNASNADESVLEIPEDELEKPKNELIAIEDSDDDGPDIVAINKCKEVVPVSEKEDKTRLDSNIAVKEFNVNYEKSSKDSDDEGPEIVAINKCQEDISVDERDKEIGPDGNISVKKFSVNQETSTEMKIIPNKNEEAKVPEINHKNSSSGSQPTRHRLRRDHNFSAINQVRKTSLLEKLLADDIRHERNVILQCIRHIVNNNFFGLAVKKS